MPYVCIAEMRNGAACSAVAHSDGNGAPTQVFEVGAIVKSCEAAESLAAREVRKEIDGIAIDDARLVKMAIVAILDNILDKRCLRFKLDFMRRLGHTEVCALCFVNILFRIIIKKEVVCG